MPYALLLALATAADPQPELATFTVDGVAREALVYAPSATSAPAPVVFAFHGHGGTMRSAAKSFGYHTHWPEAVVVYMQGLPTPGRLTDPEGKKPGWQHAPGEQEDRDLKFFDAVLADLKADHQVDEKRVYATGHSNGGAFTYVLWAARGDVFAAVAPSAAAAGRVAKDLKPKPVLHAAGEKDDLVKFDWQKRTLDHLRELNGCDKDGKPAGTYCTEYPSKGGTPVVAFVHPGGHKFPADAPPRVVAFFKQHAKK